MKFAVMVGAGRADVPATQAPSGGGHDRGGDLPAEAHLAVYGVGLAIASGEVLEAQNDVGGVCADVAEVHEWNRHEGEAYLNSPKNQKRESGHSSRPIICVRQKRWLTDYAYALKCLKTELFRRSCR